MYTVSTSGMFTPYTLGLTRQDPVNTRQHPSTPVPEGVPVTAASRQPYHHGNLREALLTAGLEITRRGGPSALALRDVTRRVGVSPNAAYRHFVDRDSLLHALSERIQSEMADRMQQVGTIAGPAEGVADAGPRAALRAVGLGYIDFALREPGWFEVAFSTLDADPAELAALPPPLAMLVSALDGLVAAGELPAGERPGAEWPCWSAVHGFAVLALHGPLRGQPPATVRSAAQRTVDAIVAGLLQSAGER